jgi:hypothetical protein
MIGTPLGEAVMGGGGRWQQDCIGWKPGPLQTEFSAPPGQSTAWPFSRSGHERPPVDRAIEPLSTVERYFGLNAIEIEPLSKSQMNRSQIEPIADEPINPTIWIIGLCATSVCAREGTPSIARPSLILFSF